MRTALPIPSEQRSLILPLCFARILSLDPSVSCHWCRTHKTLRRQWCICPSSPSPLQWNLITVRGSVTAKVTKSEVLTNSFFVALVSKFLSTTNHRMLNKQKGLMLPVCQNGSINIPLFVRIALSGFNLHITLHNYNLPISYIQDDQKVFVHMMITIQKVTSNIQSDHRQSPDIYWHAWGTLDSH
jgi:hypothetical protein